MKLSELFTHKEINFKRKAYILLFCGVFLLLFSLFINYKKYNDGSPKTFVIKKSDIELNHKLLNNKQNTIITTSSTLLVLKPKSYFQQIVFDLDPSDENILSLSFTFTYFIFALGVFGVLKNSQTPNFSKKTLNGIVVCKQLITGLVCFKLVQVMLYQRCLIYATGINVNIAKIPINTQVLFLR